MKRPMVSRLSEKAGSRGKPVGWSASRTAARTSAHCQLVAHRLYRPPARMLATSTNCVPLRRAVASQRKVGAMSPVIRLCVECC